MVVDQIFHSPQVKHSVIISNTLVYTSWQTIPVMYYNQHPNIPPWHDTTPSHTHSKCTARTANARHLQVLAKHKKILN